MSVDLWPHQERAITTTLSAVQPGRKSGLWVMPTGSGKTVAYTTLEFPTKSGHGVKVYTVCSYSAGDTYPREECRRLVL